MADQHNFEHLPLKLRYQGRARLPRGGKSTPQTLATGMHVKRIVGPCSQHRKH
jgi:hypothetical protein